MGASPAALEAPWPGTAFQLSDPKFVARDRLLPDAASGAAAGQDAGVHHGAHDRGFRLRVSFAGVGN